MTLHHRIAIALTTVWVGLSPVWGADTHDPKAHVVASQSKDEKGHAHEKDGHAEEGEGRVRLDADQLALAGIRVEPLVAAPLPLEVAAPAELRLNAYASSQVTPRIQAEVVERHARLGDTVAKGAPLITLASIAMAEAQGALRVTAREWRIVNQLGKKVVSEKRFVEAEVAYRQAQARLVAYGLAPAQTQRLADGDAERTDGRFTLLAPQAGRVIRDDFVLGQMVEPGALLFELTDESELWAEARIPPDRAAQVQVGAAAWVQADGEWIEARVIHLHHALDEATRTLGARLALPNPGDHLHPGQFVAARIAVGEAGAPVLSLPTAAVLRGPDGDWQVFVEAAPGEFAPQEVEVVRHAEGRVVVAGIAPGTPVVTQGAFLVQSELAKAGFAVHNH